MKQCSKCGRDVDKDMVICPYCGEPLYNPDKKAIEILNVHLVRFLILTALVIPFVGFIIGMCMKKRYPVFFKVIMKNSFNGLIIWIMIVLLVLICYLAMFLMGVAYM